MNDTPHILFENSATAALFRAVNPSYEGRVLSLDELVPAPENEAPARLAYLKTQLPIEAAEQAGDFLTALEELRAAPLAGSEDLDFAFSLLPESPKNRALKGLLSFYLASPLAEDRTARLVRLSDSWRAGGEPPATGNWRLVPDSARPEGLADLSQALSGARAVTEVTTGSPWNAGGTSQGNRRALHFPLTAPQSLETVAELCRRQEKTVILFQGSDVESSWLKFGLQAKGITFRDFLPPAHPTHALGASAGSHFLSILRHSPELALGDRLRLNHKLCQNGAACWDLATWTSSIERLAATGWLMPAEATLLRSLESAGPNHTPAPTGAEPRVWLLPFPGVFLPPDWALIVHADLEGLPQAAPSTLIRESEREGLASAGFYLPRASMLRAEARLAWDYWNAPASRRRWIFSTHGKTDAHVLRLPRLVVLPRQPEPSLPFEKGKPLSATQFETYARCPARYWFGHRLRVQRNDREGTGYPLLLGQLVHKALEFLFTETPELDDDAWKKSLPDTFTRALGEEAPEVSPQSRLAAELRGPFREILGEVPRLERQMRQALGNRFKPLAFERAFDFDWSGVRIRGKIDRIDVSPEGDLLILDYKTGAVDFSPGHIAAGKNFQALIYMIAAHKLYGRMPAGMLFYDLKAGEVRRGILRQAAFAPEIKKEVTRGHVLDDNAFETLFEAGWNQLQTIAERIDRGEFSATPTADGCSRCDFVALCREAIGYA